MRKNEVLDCQICGTVTGAVAAQHHSIYVKGDWEGFSANFRAQLDPTGTYLVNPFHPDSVFICRGYDPERAGALDELTRIEMRPFWWLMFLLGLALLSVGLGLV